MKYILKEFHEGEWRATRYIVDGFVQASAQRIIRSIIATSEWEVTLDQKLATINTENVPIIGPCQCLHQQWGIPGHIPVTEYRSMTKPELRQLLEIASRSSFPLTNLITVRIIAGIRGMVCPSPLGVGKNAEGMLGYRVARVNSLLYETLRHNPDGLVELTSSLYDLMEPKIFNTTSIQINEAEDQSGGGLTLQEVLCLSSQSYTLERIEKNDGDVTRQDIRSLVLTASDHARDLDVELRIVDSVRIWFEELKEDGPTRNLLAQ